jgi:hypothetical protein
VAQIAAEIAGYIVGRCKTELNPLTLAEVQSAINNYVYEELLSNRWSFLETSGSTTCTTEAIYTLSGVSDVITLKYNGVDFTRRYADPEVFFRNVNRNYRGDYEPQIWTQSGWSNAGEVIIELFGNKSISGKVLDYWYRKLIAKNDPLSMLPADMRGVVEARMMMQFAPSSYVQYLWRDNHKSALGKAKSRYLVAKNLPRPDPITPEQMRRNFAANQSLMGNCPYRAGTGHQYDSDGNFIR